MFIAYSPHPRPAVFLQWETKAAYNIILPSSILPSQQPRRMVSLRDSAQPKVPKQPSVAQQSIKSSILFHTMANQLPSEKAKACSCLLAEAGKMMLHIFWSLLGREAEINI